MTDPTDKKRSDADAELQREIRKETQDELFADGTQNEMATLAGDTTSIATTVAAAIFHAIMRSLLDD